MTNRIHTKETATELHGVAGRMFNKIINGKTGLFVNQTFSAVRPLPNSIKGFKKGSTISIEIRFDDNCGNGHQSFAITGSIKEPGYRDSSACGCIHDELTKAFPELAHLIKWHLFDTSGPMHYLANTIYHASNRDHHGKLAGEAWAWDTHAQFGNFPITFKISAKFADWIKARHAFNASTPKTNPQRLEWTPTPVAHKPDTGHDYAPKWTLVGYPCEWYQCPFDTEVEAKQFCDALDLYDFNIIKVPTQFSKGKERDFKAARSCAVWPEATDAQLSVPTEELKAALLARAAALIAAFSADMDSIGMLWEQSPDGADNA